jgi:hypothetical protein
MKHGPAAELSRHSLVVSVHAKMCSHALVQIATERCARRVGPVLGAGAAASGLCRPVGRESVASDASAAPPASRALVLGGTVAVGQLAALCSSCSCVFIGRAVRLAPVFRDELRDALLLRSQAKEAHLGRGQGLGPSQFGISSNIMATGEKVRRLQVTAIG